MGVQALFTLDGKKQSEFVQTGVERVFYVQVNQRL